MNSRPSKNTVCFFKPIALTNILEPPKEDTEVLMPLDFYSLNIACLPEKLLTLLSFVGLKYLVSALVLGENFERAKFITDQILELVESNGEIAPDILCFQEVFETDIKKYLISRLKNKFPHFVGDEKNNCCNVGGGLMIFSRYFILDSEFISFGNPPLGEELFANKGFLVANILLKNGNAINVVNTHLSSGNNILNFFLDPLSKYMGGTTAERRDKQLQKIHDYAKVLEDETFLMGDFNVPLNNINDIDEMDKKHEGKMNLFHFFEHNLPSNFKTKDLEKKENVYSGTFIPIEDYLKAKSHKQIIDKDVGNMLIDGIFKQKTIKGKLETKIIQIKNASDHRAVVGRYY